MINFEIFIFVSEILKKIQRVFVSQIFLLYNRVTESVFCIFIELFTQVEIRII